VLLGIFRRCTGVAKGDWCERRWRIADADEGYRRQRGRTRLGRHGIEDARRFMV